MILHRLRILHVQLVWLSRRNSTSCYVLSTGRDALSSADNISHHRQASRGRVRVKVQGVRWVRVRVRARVRVRGVVSGGCLGRARGICGVQRVHCIHTHAECASLL